MKETQGTGRKLQICLFKLKDTKMQLKYMVRDKT